MSLDQIPIYDPGRSPRIIYGPLWKADGNQGCLKSLAGEEVDELLAPTAVHRVIPHIGLAGARDIKQP